MRVVGVSVYVYGTVTSHESAEGKGEKSDVGALASLMNVYYPDVFVVIDVLWNKKGDLQDVENVLREGRCGMREGVSGVLLYLVEENVCGLWIMCAADAVG